MRLIEMKKIVEKMFTKSQSMSRFNSESFVRNYFSFDFWWYYLFWRVSG